MFILFLFLMWSNCLLFFFFSSRRRHTRWNCDWSSDVCSSDLDAQLEVITGDGKYFRQRLEQLAQPPAKLLDAEAERDRVLEESRGASARAGELRAQLEERDRAGAQLEGARRRAGDLERQLTARPSGYDAARHDAVRAELAKLEPVALEAAALEERARRAERLVQEAEQAEQQLSTG